MSSPTDSIGCNLSSSSSHRRIDLEYLAFDCSLSLQADYTKVNREYANCPEKSESASEASIYFELQIFATSELHMKLIYLHSQVNQWAWRSNLVVFSFTIAKKIRCAQHLTGNGIIVNIVVVYDPREANCDTSWNNGSIGRQLGSH